MNSSVFQIINIFQILSRMESTIVGNGWKCGLFNVCLGLILVVGLGILSFMFYGMIGGEYKINLSTILYKRTGL